MFFSRFIEDSITFVRYVVKNAYLITISLFHSRSPYFSEFEKHISDIYPTELQLNKANTSNKEIFNQHILISQ